MNRLEFRSQPPIACAGMKIGLLGGSFNPPHLGHRHISVMALKRLQLDRMWWLVSPGNPLKSHNELLPLEKRLELCQRLANHPKMECTGFESSRPTAYTVDTLNYLKNRFPDVHFIWVMGADNLKSFHRWKNWQTLFRLMPVVVIDRPLYRYKALTSKAAQYFKSFYIPENNASSLIFHQPPAWTFLTAPLVALSSTELREKNNLFNHKDKVNH